MRVYTKRMNTYGLERGYQLLKLKKGKKIILFNWKERFKYDMLCQLKKKCLILESMIMFFINLKDIYSVSVTYDSKFQSFN